MGRELLLLRENVFVGSWGQKGREWAGQGHCASGWLNLLCIRNRKGPEDTKGVRGKRMNKKYKGHFGNVASRLFRGLKGCEEWNHLMLNYKLFVVHESSFIPKTCIKVSP